MGVYKSLAEFELFFEEFNEEEKNKIFLELKKMAERKKPLEYDSGSEKEAGIFSKKELEKLNANLNNETLKIEELIFVFANYKMKQIKTKEVYIDMGSEIVTISQIPLLEGQSPKRLETNSNQYFYLYYKTNKQELSKDELDEVKLAIKKYFRDIQKAKRRNK